MPKEAKIGKKTATLEQLTEKLQLLEGVIFAGGLGSGGLAAECSCQNCACNSNWNGNCTCDPKCACQGHTAIQLDSAISTMLGAAAHVPLKDVKSLLELRDKIKKARGIE